MAIVRPGAAADRPNVILCMTDDQGWGDTSYNGHPVLKTPELDAMAAAGLRFNRFYAAAPLCSPTRGSVMTGRHPDRFGCFSANFSIRPEEVTIAEAVKTAGYATGHFGKWHLGPVKAGTPVNPNNSGFDETLSHDNWFDLDPQLCRNGGPPQTIEGETSEIVMGAALEFIGRQAAAKRPFLAVIWFPSPHDPCKAA
jgi:arylsulfatase A-like enzyme